MPNSCGRPLVLLYPTLSTSQTVKSYRPVLLQSTTVGLTFWNIIDCSIQGLPIIFGSDKPSKTTRQKVQLKCLIEPTHPSASARISSESKKPKVESIKYAKENSVYYVPGTWYLRSPWDKE